MKDFILKRYKDIILVILVFLITLCLSIFFNNVTFDEVWNYGFSLNISKGLIPYRDFNMLQTPFSLFMGSIFIRLFGERIISVDILNSFVITVSFFLLYKILGYKAFLLYPLFVLYTVFGYNSFCLLLLIIILTFIVGKKDYNTILGILIGICFITKQTIGVCLFVPYFYYSKNRFKSIITFLIPFLVLSIYLIYYDAFYQFIDYCFLGMLDFGSKNTNVGVLFVVEVIIVIILFIFLFKSGFRDKVLFYILSFQIMAFPLSDLYHFLISFLPVIFYILYRVRSKYIMITIGIIFYNIFFISLYRNISSNYLVMDDNYLFLKNVGYVFYNNIVSKSDVISSTKDGDYYFIIGPEAYFIKLYSGDVISKYDFLLNGNMGYHGDRRVIQDISQMCFDHQCQFYVSKGIVFSADNQFSKEVYDYVLNHYQFVNGSSYFDIYKS